MELFSFSFEKRGVKINFKKINPFFNRMNSSGTCIDRLEVNRSSLAYKYINLNINLYLNASKITTKNRNQYKKKKMSIIYPN